MWEYQLADFLPLSIHKTIKCNSIDGSWVVLLWNGISNGTALKLLWKWFLIWSEFGEISYNFTYSHHGFSSKEPLSLLTHQQQIFISTVWGITRTRRTFPSNDPKYLHFKLSLQDFPGGQGLRACLPMQGTWVQSLIQGDLTCHTATKPARCNCWAGALEPRSCNDWGSCSRGCALQQEKPQQLRRSRTTTGKSPSTATKYSVAKNKLINWKKKKKKDMASRNTIFPITSFWGFCANYHIPPN